jgi:hypothetical protein
MRLKTILKYEFGNIKGVFFLFLCFSIAVIFQLNNLVSRCIGTYDFLEENTNSVGNVTTYQLCMFQRDTTVFICVLLVVMVICQFHTAKKENTCEFVKSLPVKSEKWFLYRYLVGVVTITIPMIIMTVGSYIVRAVYSNQLSEENALSNLYQVIRQNDNMWSIFICMLLYWLLIVTLYTILVMFQMLINRCIVAGIIGAIAVVVPHYLLRTIANFQVYHMDGSYSNMDTTYVWITRWLGSFWTGVQSYTYIFIDNGNRAVEFVVYDSLILRLLIWVVCIAVVFTISYLLAKKQDVSRNDKLFRNSLVEKLFIVCLSICSGVFFTVFQSNATITVTLISSLFVAVATALLSWYVSVRLHK